MLEVFAFQVDMTMTLGDVIVAGVTAGTVISAYFALKHQLAIVLANQVAILSRLEDHDERIGTAEKDIIRIRSYGRRVGDLQEIDSD